MRVMITGTNSLLGKSLWELTPQRTSVLLTYLPSHKPAFSLNHYAPLDIRDESSIDRLMRQFRPDWILHLAAISDVDVCESSPDLATQVNVNGTRNVINASEKYGSKILFTSPILRERS